MIALAALVIGQAAVSETTVQAIVHLPALDAEETSTLRVILAVAPRRTLDFSHAGMLQITEGRPIRFSLLPDCVRLSVTLPGDQPVAAVSLVESLLRRASFDPADLAAATKLAVADRRTYWQAALDPYAYAPPKTRREEVVYLYQRLFQPANIELASAGTDSDKVQAEWLRRAENWTMPKRVGPILSPLAPTPLTRNPGGVSTIELAGKEFGPRDPALSSILLVLSALGAGKGSSLFRIWREREAWTYRQESVLWATANGWQPRLIAATKNPTVLAEKGRAALLEDIDAWTESTRVRAIGMMEAVLLYGADYSPLYLGADAQMTDSLEDQTFFKAYWQHKTGSDWDPQRLLASARLLSLEELKSIARDLVQTATQKTLP